MPHDLSRATSNLTRGQWSIWAGQQLDPDLPLYNMVLTYTFDGALDTEKFAQAFQALLNASETLRTVFEETNGVPRRRAREPFDSPLVNVDLSSRPDPEETLQRWLDERSVRAFDLTHCLFDTALLRLADERFVWYINQHHLITDGWSALVIYENLAAFYLHAKSGARGEPPALPSYEVYAEFERNSRDSRHYGAAKDYWQEKLKTPVARTEFYTASPPRPDARTSRIACVLGAERSAAMQAACGDKGVFFLNSELTVFIVFATLLFGYLHRIGNGPRLRIGAPFHNRSNNTFKETLGLFMEVYPLQVDVEEDETFSTLVGKLIREIQKVLVNAQPGLSSTASNKAYDVFLNFVNVSFPDFDGMPVIVDWPHSGYADSNHGLRLQVHDFGGSGEYLLHFDLNHSAFPRPEKSPICGHFLRIVDAFLDDREQVIGRIDLTTAAERERIAAFSRGGGEAPDLTGVLERIALQSARAPDAIAVSFRGGDISYGELQSRSNQLAHFLRGAGVGPDSLVGLCMHRSVETVVGILGVMKAGGAYVPLDPAYPEDRLGHMLEDMDRAGSSTVLLTQGALAHRFASRGGPIVRLDEDWARIAAYSNTTPRVDAGPEQLAYVIFTSGSTGRPKGVMVRHGGLAHYVNWASRFYLEEKGWSLPLYSSPSFDLTVTSLFLPLVTGGRIMVYPAEDARDALAILQVVRDDQVDLVKLTPSHLALLAGRDLRASRIKTLIVGGEDLKTAQAMAALDTFGEDVAIYNEYGPTEATVGCMVHRFDPDSDTATSVPIGRPIDGTRIHVLDRYRQPMPVGAVGELHIAGPALARGYLNQPEVTARQFVTEPFATGATMYATGDLARWREDGVLEYLGRRDEQIKLLGARIELGEVEAALLAHGEVHDAVAALHHPGSGHDGDGMNSGVERGLGLAAYYVSRVEISSTALREFLGERLPEYMVPTWFTRIDAIPLTPNGKADRKALPPPETRDGGPGDRYQAPRNPREALLAEIWASVLGLERVGVHANFFALGGDSIGNIQICSRARQRSLRVEPAQVFRHPTVASLARVAVAEEYVRAEQGPVTGPVPLTPIQQRFLQEEHPRPAHWNQALLLEIDPAPDRQHLQGALRHLLIHHDALRLRYERHDGVWRQAMAAPGEIATSLQVVDLAGLDADGQRAEMAAIEAAQQRDLDLEQGDLVRAVLFHLGTAGPARLLLIVHHLAMDAVSWYIVLQDLELAYGQLARGDGPALPSKTTSFKTWAESISRFARTPTGHRDVAWWRNVSPPRPGLAAEDFGNQDSERQLRVALAPERTRALVREVPAAYNTRTDEVLLTALMHAIPAWTGEDALVLDLEGHGREDVVEGLDLSRTVGWFTSIFPVRLTLPRGTSAPEALKSVKEQLRAVPGNGIGYGLLRYLGGDPDLSAHLETRPRSRILFNYLGRLDGLLDEGSSFRLCRELVLSQDPSCRRPYPLIIDAFVLGDTLHMHWRYSESMHGEAEIAALANECLGALEALIDHCLSPGAGGVTPADFPDARLSQEGLDDLLAEFGEG